MRYSVLAGGTEPGCELESLLELGRRRARTGWVLRSFGAAPAECAVERGCDLAGGAKEQRYVRSLVAGVSGNVCVPPASAFVAAERWLGSWPMAWNRLDGATRYRLAQLVDRLLGRDEADRVDAVLVHGTSRSGPAGQLGAEQRLLRRICTQHGITLFTLPASYGAAAASPLPQHAWSAGSSAPAPVPAS
jgi:hypothetical protein